MRLPTVFVGLLLAFPAYAGTVAPGFDTSQLARNDDGSTAAITLGFSANYFGTTYSSTFISNNGYLTFNSGQGTYTPDGLGAGYSGQPIIAAFFADVDTRAAASGITSYGTGTYAGRTAFGATWPAVGYYDQQANKLNTFQIILTDRSDTGSANFDIYLNYDMIQWETGSASDGVDGLGGTSAAAGFNAGSGNAPGSFFEIAGSRVNGAFLDGGPNSLVSSSNIGVPGQFLFTVRNGVVEVPGDPDPTPVPEPVSLALLGSGLLGLAAVRRRAG